MAIAASISAREIEEQILGRFADKYVEAVLINSPGTTYLPGVTDEAAFLSNEVVLDLGGYHRQPFGYMTADKTPYEEEGVGLATKATIFEHDGSGDVIEFTHVALVWGNGQALTITPGSGLANLIDGTYTNLPTTSAGSGVGATFNLTISSGAVASVTVSNPGSNYTVSDVATIIEADLISAGAITAGGGSLPITVNSIFDNSANANEIIAVVRTTSAVNLTNGNQAVFYWNTKLYGNN